MASEPWTVASIITLASTVVTTVATVVMAYFTVTLARITGKSVDLARDEFLSTHRPRLRIRAVQSDGGVQFGAFLKVVNVGETTATVTAVTGISAKKKGPHWLGGAPNLSRMTPLQSPSERVIEAGEERGFAFHPTGHPDGAGAVYLVGLIRYADKLGTERTTGFAWLYDQNEHCYLHPEVAGEKLPEYNFED